MKSLPTVPEHMPTMPQKVETAEQPKPDVV